MQPVKVNIFISHAPEDKAQLQKLLKWLYPMRDEVNIWYNSPPPRPPELSLPWQFLLFWYQPADNRPRYRKVILARRERAHIYLFLTSYKSLSSREVESDIEVATHRRILGNDIVGPYVFPIILSASRWKTDSRLSGYKPMAGGIPLTSYKHEDEGYLNVTEELAALIKVLQARLGEEKFYQRNRTEPAGQLKAGEKPLPYLGESDAELEFKNIEPFEPPEWLGWTILLFIFVSIIGTLTPNRILGPARYDNIPNADDHGAEYPRANPLMPPKDSLLFPPAD